MSSGESSVIRKTVRRTTTGPGGILDGGDNIEVVRNYQVYRGMSPNTSNRLEIRLRELEDALEAERQARLRAEQELTNISIELTTVTERLEEAEGYSGNQSESNRKRDAEFNKMRKDYDLLSMQHESELANLKKRHQDALNELADQLEQLNKNKSRFEKEKQTLIFEIEGSNSALDASNKARAHAESKLEGLEDQVRRLKTQLDEFARQNQDLANWKAKLGQENQDLHRQLHDLDSNTGSLAKARSLLQTQIDDLKAQLDDVTSERNNLSISLNNAQIELDNVASRYDEESEQSVGLRNQLQKALADLAQLKSRYEQDINIRVTEYEDSRRKTSSRLAELEDLLEQAKNKAARLEKDKLKLTIEIRDISNEFETVNFNSLEMGKRLKQAEGLNSELSRRTEELSTTLNGNGGEVQRMNQELMRAKQALAELQEKYDQLARENKKLSDALRDSQGQNKDLTRQVQDLLNIRNQLEQERDRLALELSDALDSLKDAHARLDGATAALNQLKIDFEHRLREKDEELDNARKNSHRGMDELQKTIIELETKYKNELGRLKKKHESDIREYEIQIDTVSRSNSENGKASKGMSMRIKELETIIESERMNGDDAKNSLTVSERKRIALQTELEDVRALLEAADRARKNAEAALGDNSSRVNELNISFTAAAADKRRLEGELANALAMLDDSQQARRGSDERADRLQLEVNRLAQEVQRAQDSYAQADNLRKNLESELREISVRLEEAESYAQKEGKRLVSKLQSRVRELEAELESESRRGRDAVAENKKLQRILQELRVQADEDHRLVIELTEQVNSLQSKIAQLKRQLLEADEVISITLAKYRKAQQQLEECERRAETAERNITVHVTRGASSSVHHRGTPLSMLGGMTIGGDGSSNRARSMSVTRETHRVMRA